MKAIVLAAGRSKRMHPIGDKNFLNFLGKPLIQRQLEFLTSHGFEEILVVGSCTNLEKIEEIGKKITANVSVYEQKDLDLGMAGAILTVKDYVKNSPILIVSSNDVVEDSALENIMKEFKNGTADSYILGKKVDSYFPGGYLETDENNNILSVIEKPGEGNEPSDLVNLVFHIHKNSNILFKTLEDLTSQNDDIYELAMGNMIKKGMKMKAVSYDGFWQPIKYPWHIHRVFNYYFDKSDKYTHKSAKIAKNAVINGEVIIEENVKIFDGAVINGPAYIGKNSIIATNALLRESHIGEDCVVGFNTEVARSYWANKVWTHMNYVGDSIISNNVSFGAGSITGNYRLDEQEISVYIKGNKVNTTSQKMGAIIGENVRVGINTSIMPGIKIGSNTFIGAGILVSQNIEDKKFVRGTWDLKISDNRGK